MVLGDLPNIEDMNENLQKYIKTKNYIVSEDPWFWKKLRYYLNNRKYRKKSDTCDIKNVKQVPRGSSQVPDPVTPTEEKDLPSYFRRISRDFLISGGSKKNAIFECIA